MTILSENEIIIPHSQYLITTDQVNRLDPQLYEDAYLGSVPYNYACNLELVQNLTQIRLTGRIK